MFNPQDLLAVGVRLAGIERGELAADHHGDDIVFAHAAGIAGADVLAVADHADRIGDRFDLIELMRDIDAGDIVVLQIANDRQQRRGFLFGQGGGRFVEDQQANLFIQRLGDLHQLLLTKAEVADAGIGRNGRD